MVPEEPLSNYSGEDLVLLGENHSSEDSYSLERELILALEPEYLLYEGFFGSDEELDKRVSEEGPYLSLVNLKHFHDKRFPESQFLGYPAEIIYQESTAGKSIATRPIFDLPSSDINLVLEAATAVDLNEISQARREFLEESLGEMKHYYNELSRRPVEFKRGYMMIDSAYKNMIKGSRTHIRQLDKKRECETNNDIRKIIDIEPEEVLSEDWEAVLPAMREITDAVNNVTEIATDEERDPEMEKRIRQTSDKAGDRPVMAIAGSAHIRNIAGNFETDTYTLIENTEL